MKKFWQNCHFFFVKNYLIVTREEILYEVEKINID